MDRSGEGKNGKKIDTRSKGIGAEGKSMEIRFLASCILLLISVTPVYAANKPITPVDEPPVMERIIKIEGNIERPRVIFIVPRSKLWREDIVENSFIDERGLENAIRDWEDCMLLIGQEDISIETALRLSEDYFEAKDILHKKKMERYYALAKKVPSREMSNHRRNDYQNIIKYLKVLVDHYRDEKGADSLLYALGYALYERGEGDEAVKVFEDIIAGYPQSGYMQEINFRVGEFYFETGQMEKAVNAYSMVLSSPQSIFYDKAMYKLGWIYYKNDQFEKAADTFISLMDTPDNDVLKKGSLFDESLFCAVMSLSRFSSVDLVIEYLKSNKRTEYTHLLFEKLGETLNQQTRYEEAIHIYKYLIEIYPDAPSIPFTYEKMANIYRDIKDDDSALAMEDMMIQRFGPLTELYKEKYQNGPAAIDKLIADKMIHVAKTYYLKGKGGGKEYYRNKAISICRDFLISFPDSPDYREINLMLAEVLFDAGLYHEASKEYDKTAYFYSNKRQSGEIAYSAILSYAIVFNQSVNEREEVIKSILQVLDAQRDALSSAGKMEKTIYILSDMYIQTGEFNKAREILFPLTKLKEPIAAYRKIAESYLLEGNLEGADGVYSILSTLSKDPEILRDIAGFYYEIGEDYLKSGRLKDAYLKFENAFNASPDSNIGEDALLKLGLIHLYDGDADKVINVVNKSLRLYPGSMKSLSLLIEAGRKFEGYEPLKAAVFYEIASYAIHSENSKELLFKSATLYEEGKVYHKAVALFNKYLTESESPDDREGEALYRIGYLQIKRGRKADGINTLKLLVDRKGMSDHFFIAKAELILMEEKMGAYLSINIKQPFQETLKKKAKALNSIIRDYSDMIKKYKIPDILPHVFFYMGAAIENYRDSILHSERPANLTRDEIEEYNLLLKKEAYSYEGEAVKTYENGLQISREYKIYNEWVRKILDRLANLRPTLYKMEFAFEKGKI